MAPTASEIYKILKKQYSKTGTVLRYKNPLELLIATMLSAQCTDKRVNIVTESLFKKYRDAADYASADIGELEQEIRPTGFYRNKAKNIIAAARMIVSEFGGKVPADMESLVRLPGVARKTANIVLYNAFHITAGIAVDTHVGRVSRRLGLSDNTDPVKIEQDLMRQLDRPEWGPFTNVLVQHGRAVCDAKKPRCPECRVKHLCPSGKKWYPIFTG
jgi:endonuclease-3